MQACHVKKKKEKEEVNDSGYFGRRSNYQQCHQWGFWSSGNVLYLNLGGSYMGVFFVKFHQDVYFRFMYITVYLLYS